MATISGLNADMDKAKQILYEKSVLCEETQMKLSEYSELFYISDKLNSKQELDLAEADKNIRKLDRENKKKDKTIKELKGNFFSNQGMIYL